MLGQLHHPGSGTTIPIQADETFCLRDELGGRPNPGGRKVERPPYERLLEEIEATSYLAVGRKYGVSDNAVRKWVRWYERQREREAAEREGAADAA